MEKQDRSSYKLSQLAVNLSYDDLPDEVITTAKSLILDSIACTVAGAGTPQGQTIIDLYKEMGGRAQAGIAGTLHRVPALNAVYANSYLATVLDMDDTYDGHPGSTIVPVALSLGEHKQISGKRLIEAVVAGYEVGIRISNAIKPTPERTKIVRGINTWQVFCAAAVAAKILDLDLETTASTYSHAAMHASVPSLRKWGFIDGRIQWLKNNFGYTSYGGTLSAMLADKGFVADTTILDGKDGFWIMASSDRCNYEAMQESLDTFYLLKVHTKPYPACRHIHPTLDALTDIVTSADIDPSHVEQIKVETFYEVVQDYTSLPSIPFDVVFCAPFLSALVLHKVPPGPEWFREDHLTDNSILETARKVSFEDWDEASRLYPLVNRELISKVTVEEDSGLTHHQEIRIPKGDPRNPMSEDQLVDKFTRLAGLRLNPDQVKKIPSLIMDELENLESIEPLVSSLRPEEANG